MGGVSVLIPAKCGNWIHFPVNTADEYTETVLRHRGFRFGRECFNNPGWYHVHPPRGWKQVIDRTAAILYDTRGRERLVIHAGSKTMMMPSRVQVIPYYCVYFAPYLDPAAKRLVVLAEIRDPDGNVYCYGIALGTRWRPERVDFELLKRQVIRLFMVSHDKDHATDPFAYWD